MSKHLRVFFMINELRSSEKHASQNKRKIWTNQAPLMTKKLSKTIMKRSKSKNLCFKWHSRENFCTYKNEKQMYNVIKYAKRSNSKKK